MSEMDLKYECYEKDYELIVQNSAGIANKIRSNAWKAFVESGMPVARKGNEKWKYTNVNSILEKTFRKNAKQLSSKISAESIPCGSTSHIKIVLLDGHLSEDLSSNMKAFDGITITTIQEGLDVGNENKHFAKHSSLKDGFVSLNTALFNEGISVEVEPKTEPITLELLHFTTGSKGVANYPRLLVNLKENSNLTLIEGFFSNNDGEHFTDAVTEIVLDPGSRMVHARVMLENLDSVHMGTTNVYQSSDSEFKSASFSKGSKLARNEMSVLLDGPGSSCDLSGLYLTVDDQHVDNLINIDHAKPNCTSNIKYKGILDGNSRAIFGGEVIVRKDAQKTNALQSDKNLVLSNGAEIDSKPSLWIYADDVQCGHGATAGSINGDTVFYMKSRGLDERTASRFLIHAFAREIIETIDDPDFMQYLDDMYESSIPDVTLNLA
ncbi:MAG TPA: Fe-S cluster assembly protein SufD [Dehalococcoidia bacterium]|nr:Fe-S cluster assembly protein SufD [Dehalococcoidia bacterium]